MLAIMRPRPLHPKPLHHPKPTPTHPKPLHHPRPLHRKPLHQPKPRLPRPLHHPKPLHPMHTPLAFSTCRPSSTAGPSSIARTQPNCHLVFLLLPATALRLIV